MPRKLTKREYLRRLAVVDRFWKLESPVIGSIDPAGLENKATRGFALIYAYAMHPPQHGSRWHGRLLKTTNDVREARGWTLDVVVCEDQYPDPNKSRQSLMTLSKGAGFLCGELDAPLKLFIPVRDWKNAIIPGFWNAPKKMFTNNLGQKWPEVTNSHCLDAVGLGMAVARRCFTADQLIEWMYD